MLWLMSLSHRNVKIFLPILWEPNHKQKKIPCFNNRKEIVRECIPVGCVPSAAVEDCWGCLQGGVSQGAVCLAVSARRERNDWQTGVKTLPCCNYVGDRNNIETQGLYSNNDGDAKYSKWTHFNCMLPFMVKVLKVYIELMSLPHYH